MATKLSPTSFNLDPDLLSRFKSACAKRRTKMTTVVSRLIEAWIEAAGKLSDDESDLFANASTTELGFRGKLKHEELVELVNQFVVFATAPEPRDEVWSKYTLELLRERIAEREADRSPDKDTGKA